MEGGKSWKKVESRWKVKYLRYWFSKGEWHQRHQPIGSSLTFTIKYVPHKTIWSLNSYLYSNLCQHTILPLMPITAEYLKCWNVPKISPIYYLIIITSQHQDFPSLGQLTNFRKNGSRNPDNTPCQPPKYAILEPLVPEERTLYFPCKTAKSTQKTSSTLEYNLSQCHNPL